MTNGPHHCNVSQVIQKVTHSQRWFHRRFFFFFILEINKMIVQTEKYLSPSTLYLPVATVTGTSILSIQGILRWGKGASCEPHIGITDPYGSHWYVHLRFQWSQCWSHWTFSRLLWTSTNQPHASAKGFSKYTHTVYLYKYDEARPFSHIKRAQQLINCSDWPTSNCWGP